MKNLILMAFVMMALTSCKESSEEPAEKPKVKLYIIAGTGINTSAVSFQLSGTNITTVNNISNSHILEVNYPTGETQTVTLKATLGDPDLVVEVSKSVSMLVSDRVAYKTGKGTISVSFVP